MIPIEQSYDAILTLVREDKRGLALSPMEFNRIANIVNDRLFEKRYKEYEATLKVSDELNAFLVSDTLTLFGYAGVLPLDYRIMVGKPYIMTEGRYLDYVTKYELYERREDYLTKPSAQYPVWTYGGEAGGYKIIFIYPTTLTGDISFDYLRNPTTPFYDYYVNDTTAVITYMDVSANVIIPLGSTYRDGTAGDGVTSFPSTSVDWEWNREDLQIIITLFASILGIALPDQFLTEVSNVEETKLKD